MKLKIIAFFWFLSTTLSAQCDFEGLVREGNIYFSKGDYRKALNAFTAARTCDFSRAKEADKYINNIFERVERQRDQAVSDKTEAQKLQAEAERNEARIKSATEEIRVGLEELKASREKEKKATAEKDLLLRKAQHLQFDLSEDNARPYLIDLGQKHFAYNAKKHSRDYRNALTYLAVASFLEEDSTLFKLIQCCNNGIIADSLFYTGKLDKAKEMYQWISETLRGVDYMPEYEEKQIINIDEVRTLGPTINYQEIKKDGTLRLKGKWWCIPDLKINHDSVAGIIFDGNPNMENIFYDLNIRFKNIYWIAIINCEVEEISNWENLSKIYYLYIYNNPKILYIKGLNELKNLRQLSIYGNSLLRHIDYFSIKSLNKLEVQANYRLRSVEIDSSFASLETITLSDISFQNKLNFNNLVWLQNVKLENLSGLTEIPSFNGCVDLKNVTFRKIAELQELPSLKDCSKINSINLSGNPNLKNMKAISGLPFLDTLIIIDNNKLKSLTGIKDLPKLSHLHIEENDNLRSMFSFKETPNIRTLDISANLMLKVPSNYALKHLNKSFIEYNRYRFALNTGLGLMAYSDSLNKILKPVLISSVDINFFGILKLSPEILFPIGLNGYNRFESQRQRIDFGQPAIFNLSLCVDFQLFYLGGFSTYQSGKFMSGGAFGIRIPIKNRLIGLNFKISEFPVESSSIGYFRLFSIDYSFRLGQKKTWFKNRYFK